jgi:repressor LexA
MIEAGIVSGDYIFVRKQPTANAGRNRRRAHRRRGHGQVLLPRERLRRASSPRTPRWRPSWCARADFKPTMLLGIVVVGVYRKL